MFSSLFLSFAINIAVISIVSLDSLCEAVLTDEESKDVFEAFRKIKSNHTEKKVSMEDLVDTFAQDVATSLADTDPHSLEADMEKCCTVIPKLAFDGQSDKDEGIRVLYLPLWDQAVNLKNEINKRPKYITDVIDKFGVQGMAPGVYEGRRNKRWLFFVVSIGFAEPTEEERAEAIELQTDLLMKLELDEERNDLVNLQMDRAIWSLVTDLANKRREPKLEESCKFVSVVFEGDDQLVNKLLTEIKEKYKQDLGNKTQRVNVSLAFRQERSYSTGEWKLGPLHVVAVVITRPVSGASIAMRDGVLTALKDIDDTLGKHNKLATEIAEYISTKSIIDSAATYSVAVGATAFVFYVSCETFDAQVWLDKYRNDILKEFKKKFGLESWEKKIFGSGIEVKEMKYSGGTTQQFLVLVVIHEEIVSFGAEQKIVWVPTRENSNAEAMVLAGESAREYRGTDKTNAYSYATWRLVLKEDKRGLQQLAVGSKVNYWGMAYSTDKSKLYAIQCKKPSQYAV